jgi:NodT family efflux transporter outer membrane factor (OMF) lipoprotein
LVQQAVRANFDLGNAAARVREARAQLVVSSAALWPEVSLSGSKTRRRTSANTIPTAQAGGFSFAGVTNTTYQANFDATWELDLFGGIRRGIEAAQADVDAAVEDGRSVLVSLLGELARNYTDVRTNQQLLAITRENAHAQQETLDISRARYRGGLTTELDVARAEAQLENTVAQIPNYDTAVKKAIHRIGVLLGQEPGAVAKTLEKEAPVPVASAQVLAGLPSDLLRRRPDIRRAERQLASATAEIGVAIADLFPKLNLTAMVGLQSIDASTFFNGGSQAWSIAQSVSAPIFNAGRLRANVAVKNAQQQQALNTYQNTIYSALEEVENALVAYRNEQTHRASLHKAVQANTRAVDLAQLRYRKGLSNFLDVLDAQRSLYSAQSSLQQADANVSTNLIALYKALGGGWEGFGTQHTLSAN